MKNLQWIAVIFAGFLIGSSSSIAPVYAQNPCHLPLQHQQMGYSDGVVDKFSRGFANTATGWMELPKNIVNESRASNVGYGITLGLFQGVIHTVGRTLIGVVELGTFFIPNAAFIHPRFVWSPLEENTSYGSQTTQ